MPVRSLTARTLVSGAAVVSTLALAAACSSGSGSGAGPTDRSSSIRIPRTGQTESVSAGDDGSLQQGVAWPSPRFSAAEGGKTMVDHLTGLMWARTLTTVAECGWHYTDTTKDEKTWEEALAYVGCLNEKGYLGHRDWRMPNRVEMRSLLQNDALVCEDGARAQWLRDEGFGVPEDCPSVFFTSTAMAYAQLCPQDGHRRWDVNLCAETYFNSPGNLTPYQWVWPVRDAEGVEGVARLPVTGIAACYSPTSCDRVACAGTGQDGEARKGVKPPSPRFVTNADTTVTDRLTGLIWGPNGNLPDPNPSGSLTRVSWQEALVLIRVLNGEGYLGHDDWRLPNINELASLGVGDIEVRQLRDELSDNGIGVKNTSYWSSTWGTRVTHTATLQQVWTMDLAYGSQQLTPLTEAGCCQVLPVRGGP